MSHIDAQSNGKHLFRGALAGVVGGLVASFVMNEFQAALKKGKQAVKEQTESPQQLQHEKEKQAQQKKNQPDDATEKTADAIAHATTGDHLSKQQKETYGPVVHYAFGAAMGAIYGAIAEYSTTSRFGFGTLFGTVVFLGADETAVPALGLSKSPTQEPATAQISPWLAHLAYGSTLELVRRGVRTLLG